jgi:hypothetical protein
MGHPCELGALCHDAHNFQRALVLDCLAVATHYKPVKPSRSSNGPNPGRNLSIPVAPIWLRDCGSPNKDIFGFKAKGFDNDK